MGRDKGKENKSIQRQRRGGTNGAMLLYSLNERTRETRAW